MKNNNRLKILAATLVWVLVIMACGLSLKNGTLIVPITLKEETLKSILNNTQKIFTSTSGNDVQVQVDDLQFVEPDSITVLGTYTTEDGQQVNGGVDLTFSVVDDQPQVKISSVNIPGMDIDQETIDQANQALSQMIQEQIDQSGQAGVVKSISVEGQTLKIILEVPLKRNNTN